MSQNEPNPTLTYRDSGVDIAAGNALVDRIKPMVKSTHRAGVLGAIGGFGGLFELPTTGYKQPVLVSGTDGVGTKLRLAIDMQQHDSVGIDLVAMCVNDILVAGAEPLFFLDYYATGKLDVDAAASVISGIAEGCRQSGCALSGGETAEMPGMYENADYDLAGFAVGIVEKDQLLTADNVSAGDQIIGIASSGIHSNGFSLVRKILETHNIDLQSSWQDGSIGQRLLVPTTIYVNALLPLIKQQKIKALSHITGGGITENLPRSLPANHVAHIDLASWQRDKLFSWLQQKGGVSDSEMLTTFNCGIGMAVMVAQESCEEVLDSLRANGHQADVIGHIKAAEAAANVTYTGNL